MKCRFCKTTLKHEFIDLVNSPPANSLLTEEQLNEPEIFYPLKLYVCHQCFLVQIDEYKKSDEIFNQEYVYFSSYSSSWLNHARQYVEMMTQRFGIDSTWQVIEVASNDGYLLQYFKQKGIPVLGIDPTANTARVAIDKGIPTIIDFFGTDFAKKRLADENIRADLLIGNNVLAHVPDINDFVEGLKIALAPQGIITMEFPHLLRLIEQNQFDTIYHEHFSYLSFHVVKKIFESHDLEMFDVEEIPTHGGSLRIYARHQGDSSHPVSENVARLLEKEDKHGMNDLRYYTGFQQKADRVKYALLGFLLDARKAGKKVIGYGAAAKGSTLLNYCGVKKDLIAFIVDASPYKQGKYMPASHIPIVDKSRIDAFKPDYILILPWNIKEEIMSDFDYVKSWGCKFVIPIPSLQIID